jgi:hypothetical protein
VAHIVIACLPKSLASTVSSKFIGLLIEGNASLADLTSLDRLDVQRLRLQVLGTHLAEELVAFCF